MVVVLWYKTMVVHVPWFNHGIWNPAHIVTADHNFTAISIGHAHKYFVSGYFIAHVRTPTINKMPPSQILFYFFIAAFILFYLHVRPASISNQ